MKTLPFVYSLFLSLVFTLFPQISQAAPNKTWNLEAGSSLFMFNNLHPAQQIALASHRWQWEYGYVEADAGGWWSARNSKYAGIGFGGSYGGWNLGSGWGWITRPSDALSTHWQYKIDLMYRFKEHGYFIAFRHVSNGHKVFNHTHTPNVGENFITVGITF